MPDTRQNFADLLHDIDMSEPAEQKTHQEEEHHQAGGKQDDFKVSCLSVPVLECGENIIVHKGGDDVKLKYEGESKDQCEADHIESSFCHNGTHEFLRGNFFIAGQDRAFYHFTQSCGAQIYEITDHYGEKGIQAGRVVAHRLHQLAPAECPQPVTCQQEA